MRAWRILGVALVVSIYFATAPLGYGLFAIWSVLPTRDPTRRALTLQTIMMIAFRSMHAVLRWLWILDFDPRRIQGEMPDDPCVLVANHPTLTDISALLAATGRGLVYPVKPPLFRSFWAHPLLEQADHVEGASQDPFSAGRVIDEVVERIHRGYRVIIFPEGTRSPEEGLHPFGRAAFEIAVRAGVPVVPLVITCRPRWLTHGQRFLDPPAEVPKLDIRVLPPLTPEGAGSSSRTLRDMVSARISSELARASFADGREHTSADQQKHTSADQQEHASADEREHAPAPRAAPAERAEGYDAGIA